MKLMPKKRLNQNSPSRHIQILIANCSVDLNIMKYLNIEVLKYFRINIFILTRIFGNTTSLLIFTNVLDAIIFDDRQCIMFETSSFIKISSEASLK